MVDAGDAFGGLAGLAHLSDRLSRILPSILSSVCSDDVESANPRFILLAEKLTVAFTDDAKPGQREMMASRSRFNGKVKLGCRHCFLKEDVLPKGAQAAPQNLNQIYRHLGRTLSNHIEECAHVPEEELAELKALAKRRKVGTEQYLPGAAEKKGYLNKEGGGIGFCGTVGNVSN